MVCTRGSGRMIRAVTAATLALLPLTAAACGGNAGDPETGHQQTRVPVGIALVSRDSLVESLALTGRLVPRPGGSAILAAPAAGVMRSVNVQIGDRVKRGEPSRSSRFRSLPPMRGRRRRRPSRPSGKRRASASSSPTGSRRPGRWKRRRRARKQAAAAASAARELLSRTHVVSPISGRVQECTGATRRAGRRGQGAGSGGGPRHARPRGPGPRRAVEAAESRDFAATVTQEGDTGSFVGRLAALAPGVDSLTNAGQAVIRVSNLSGRLHPGAGASARVRSALRPTCSWCPTPPSSSRETAAWSSSSARTRSHTSAWCGAGSRREGGSRSRARAPGDRVVTIGAFGLQDGMRVDPPGEHAVRLPGR